MAWLYVPGLACSTKECAPHPSFLDGTIAPSVTSKGKLMQPQALSRAWKTALWMKRLSGLTLSPSTASHGVERWIASLPVSRANPTASRASGRAKKTPAGSGQTLPESFATYLLGWFFSKTSGASFPVAGSKRPSERWPAWGSMRNGECYLRGPWVPVTGANGSLFWPTATVCGNYNRAGLSESSGDGLSTAAANWATPMAADDGRKVTAVSVIGLIPQVSRWATPCASENANRTTKNAPSHGVTHGFMLAGQAAQWATPQAFDAKDINRITPPDYSKAGHKNLCAEARMFWSTRKASEPNRGLCPSELARNSLSLLAQTEKFSHPAQITADGTKSLPGPHTLRRRLNPAFTCWLMGWPWWWTIPAPINFAQSAMVSYRSRLQLHLLSLRGELKFTEHDAMADPFHVEQEEKK